MPGLSLSSRRLLTSPLIFRRGLAAAGLGLLPFAFRPYRAPQLQRAMAVRAASSAMPTVRVSLCADVQGLREGVEKAFAASALSSRYSLSMEDLPVDGDRHTDNTILLADPNQFKGKAGHIPGLKWLQSTWAGVNALAGLGLEGVTCTRAGGCFDRQISEYVFGAIFMDMWAKATSLQSSQTWDKAPFKGRPRLSDMTIGTLGAGSIPNAIAQAAHAFGAKTLGLATSAGDRPHFDVVTTDLDVVLSQADIIVNVLPSTPRTSGLLDGGRLEACGTGKLFINVGRGDVVSEESLVDALDKGWLRRAVLDVFVQEPLPTSSPLWRHPSIQVTPHIAGVDYVGDIALLFVENLALWVDGLPLRFVADLEKGY